MAHLKSRHRSLPVYLGQPKSQRWLKSMLPLNRFWRKKHGPKQRILLRERLKWGWMKIMVKLAWTSNTFWLIRFSLEWVRNTALIWFGYTMSLIVGHSMDLGMYMYINSKVSRRLWKGDMKISQLLKNFAIFGFLSELATCSCNLLILVSHNYNLHKNMVS